MTYRKMKAGQLEDSLNRALEQQLDPAAAYADLPEEELFILRTAAIVHDIGIKVSEEKYGNSSGK